MNSREDEYMKLVKKINKKMENPVLRKQVDEAISKIETIFDTQIDISLVFRVGLEEYKEIFNEYNENGQLEDDLPDNVLTLGDLKKYLDNETDNNLKLTIDPLFLDKKGINEIYDLLITTLDDRIILVPKNKIDE